MLTEELLKRAITAKYVMVAFREPDNIHFKGFVELKDKEEFTAQEYDLIMNIINRNGRFERYKEYLKYEISYYPLKNQETVEFPLDIGAVIFLEYIIKDNDGDPYECEETQFYLLLDPSIDSVKTITRRGSKTFSDKVPTLRDAICYPGHGTQVTEQSMTVAKFWLDDIYMWFYNSKLLQEWAGGMDLLKDSEKHIKFKNRSFIMVHTASSLESISGIGVNKQISDEKSLYTTDTARGRIVARGQRKKKGRKRVTFRTSGTPFGSGTSFHKDQINTDKWQYFAPMLCPMGYKDKPICYDCDYFTQTKYRRGELPSLQSLECTTPLPMTEKGFPDLNKCYKRIPDDRIVNRELLEDWRDLGKTLFMQEYMCATQDYTGNAIPLDLIHSITNSELERNFKSDLLCFVGVDFGLSENHRSAISVVGMEENGNLVNLNTMILPAGTPYRTRDITSGDHRKGVVETALGLFKNYPNIMRIAGDAMGVGKDYVERDMVDLAMKLHGFSNIVAYKTTGHSKGPLWFGTIKPAMETGRIKTYMDRDLYLQMRAWRMDYDASKQAKPRLHPPKAGEVKSDDALMAFFMALWAALTSDEGTADAELAMGSISSHEAYGPTVFEKGAYE